MTTSPSTSSTRGIFQETRKGQFKRTAPFSCPDAGFVPQSASGSISRVLSLGRPFISNACHHASQARNPSARKGTVSRSYLRLLQMGFTKPRRCRRAGALLPHRFSFSAVAARRSAFSRKSLLFCGTDPSGRPAQPLAGILPFGARTFLTPCGARPSGPLAYNSVPRACSK